MEVYFRNVETGEVAGSRKEAVRWYEMGAAIDVEDPKGNLLTRWRH